MVYRADFTNKANNDQQFYFDLVETTFKERYINHKRDIKHIKYRKVLFQACNFVTKRKTRSKTLFEVKYQCLLESTDEISVLPVLDLLVFYFKQCFRF